MGRRWLVVLAVGGVVALALLYGGSASLSGYAFGLRDDCSFRTLASNGTVTPVVAECVWDVPPERIHAVLRDFDAHDTYFSNLTESTLLDAQQDGALVHQVHSLSPLSDREVVVEWRVQPVAKGVRYAWSKSADQSRLSGRGLPVAVHEGRWEVQWAPAGARVIYEVHYAPGGDVPFFLVRWFQGAGVRRVVSELEAAARRRS